MCGLQGGSVWELNCERCCRDLFVSDWGAMSKKMAGGAGVAYGGRQLVLQLICQLGTVRSMHCCGVVHWWVCLMGGEHSLWC